MNPPQTADSAGAAANKQRAAQAALDYVQADSNLGIGSGSTVNALIELLAGQASRLRLRR